MTSKLDALLAAVQENVEATESAVKELEERRDADRAAALKRWPSKRKAVLLAISSFGRKKQGF